MATPSFGLLLLSRPTTAKMLDVLSLYKVLVAISFVAHGQISVSYPRVQ